MKQSRRIIGSHDAARLLAPVKGLVHLAAPKSAAATLLTVMDIRPIIGKVFSVGLDEAILLVSVLAADFITGVYASWWKKSAELKRNARPMEFFESIRLRQSVVKLIEYLLLLLLINAGGNVWAEELGWAQQWAFIYIFVTELWSVAENMQHSPARRLVSAFKENLMRRSENTYDHKDANKSD